VSVHRPGPPAAPPRARAARVGGALLALGLAACHPPARHGFDTGPVVDAPYELADTIDFDMARDRVWAMAPGPAAAAARRALVPALIDRARAHLAGRKPDLAHRDLLDLAALYAGPGVAADELGPALAPERATLRALIAAFARAGNDQATITALALAGAADPDVRADAAARITEILEFVDDLGAAQFGEVGRGAAPITSLGPIAQTGAVAAVTDQYIGAITARQARLGALFQSGQVTYATVAAHREVNRSARMIAVPLGRAGRAPAIGPAIGPIQGIGADRALARTAGPVARPAASAGEFEALADALATGDDGDPIAALAVDETALVRFPDDPALLAAAATRAVTAGRLEQAIALDRAALALTPRDAGLRARLAGLYGERTARLAQTNRPRAAAAELAAIEQFLAAAPALPAADAAKIRAAALVALAKAQAGQGELDAAIALARRARAAAPSPDADELLATIALKRDRWAEAAALIAAALRAPHDTPEAALGHARLLRLAGDAELGAGRPPKARGPWLRALDEWSALGDQLELSPALASQRLIESGKLMWLLGEHARALALFDGALDAAPDDDDTYVPMIEFLLASGAYDRAADAYHHALGADGISGDTKVYLALWLLAEARATGRAPDPLAQDYLAARQGQAWTDDLARLATRRADLAVLTSRAVTRGRKVELAYYRAVLDLGPASASPTERRLGLRQVVASDLVVFYEYDLARRFLRADAQRSSP
jgi:tetratricopeptide (TPR) repeat protein